MNPIKLKLGALPKVATQLTPVPGAPPPLQNNTVTRPNAVGAQATVKSPKPKGASDMAKSDKSNKGVMKLKAFLDNSAQKKNTKLPK